MDQVRSWYLDDGKSVRQVARMAGVSSRTAWRRMTDAGIPMRPAGQNGFPPGAIRRVPEAEDAAIRDALRTGEKVEDVAARFGRGTATVSRRARSMGLRLRGPYGEHDRSRVEQLREAHGRGLRGSAIDRERGWPLGTASAIQRRLGLETVRQLSPGDAARAYARLGSIRAAALELRKSEKSVRAALAEAGVTPARRRREPRPHRLDASLKGLREARERGEGPVSLAARHGVTASLMASYLHRHGLVSYRRLGPGDHERIVQLRSGGMSRKQIARTMGVSYPTVARHLDRGPGARLERFANRRPMSSG